MNNNFLAECDEQNTILYNMVNNIYDKTIFDQIRDYIVSVSTKCPRSVII